MKVLLRSILLLALLIWALLVSSAGSAQEQQEEEPGRPIGKVSVTGGLILVELNAGVLGTANLFNLTGRTLRFTPEGRGYRVESRVLQWNPDYGAELPGAEVRLQKFRFPFSRERWDSFLVGMTGTIRFGVSEKISRSIRTGVETAG